MHQEAKRLTYLDNNATTAIAPEVFEAMVPYLTELYGNPSSAYAFGKRVGASLIAAREKVAALINADPKEIFFTSCGTESDNTAIWSALRTTGKKHLVTTAVEHSAIMNQGEYLETQGYKVTWLKVNPEGELDLKELESSIHEDTGIVSIMTANNETGVIFPIKEIAEICHKKGVLFHTDAVQCPGKIKIDVRDTNVDFLSLSGHKLHAPKGVGVLFVKRRTKLLPYVVGGGQERGKRGGTENVASIVGLGKAAELSLASLNDEQTRVRALRDKFEKTLEEKLPNIYINGKRDARLPNTSNIAFDFVEAEAILLRLDLEGICCSSGSACTTGSLDPSHVLSAMGLTPARARSCVRFSFSHYNTEADVDYALKVIPPIIEKLRAMSPLNPSHTDNHDYDVEAAREKEEKLMAETMAKINE
ncbi:MAG: cysteine desulfurase NifS [Verrucomicrobia bacterium Tous-C9LFEB]|nr:MAG: cysteine desulfurase NifS [Verrucomicrobia bacterium Tous-C9LFEB]